MVMEIAGKPAAMVEVAPIEVAAAGEMATAKMAAAQAATTKVAAAAHSAATPASCERFMGEADAAKREDRSNGRNFE